MKSLYILSDSTGVGQFVSIHKTWPVLLAQHLEGKWNVQNVSRNGETSRQALERLVPDVLRFEPDAVYIQYGSNDANKWKTDKGMPRVERNEFISNLISISHRCENVGVSAFIGTNHTGAYNNQILAIADRNIAAHHNYKGNYMLDHVHLNERGHQLYFDTIKELF